VDEVTSLLEDQALALGSIATSPHCHPFAEEVQLWERRLSLVGEAIEVRAAAAVLGLQGWACNVRRPLLPARRRKPRLGGTQGTSLRSGVKHVAFESLFRRSAAVWMMLA
jgi:hypothetical protein